MPEGINQLDAAQDTTAVGATTGARIHDRAALAERIGAMSLAAIYGAALGAILIGVGGFAVFGIVAMLFLAGGLFAINRLKHSLLGEPILPMDFTLLGHAFRFPSLYFGFLKPAAACAIAGGVALVAGVPAAAEFVLGEPTRISSAWTRGALVLAGLFAWLLRHRFAGLIGIADWARRRGFAFDPSADVRRFGLLPTLAVYDLASGDRPHIERVRAMSTTAQADTRHAADPFAVRTGAKLPDIVLVQAESFFDARRLGLAQPGIDDAMVNFSRLQRSAFAHGTLDVLSSGGNSLRSEFAVLSGMSATESGVHALNPYHRLARDKVWSLAWHLRALGYRTVAVHPYNGNFFWRDKVYAHLGFERFIDINALGHLPRCGPFVSDIALGSEIERLRAAMDDDRPTFIFVITMEAHGPWHPTRVSEVELAEAGLSAPQLGSMQLAHYLYHARNTDRMLGALAAQTTKRSRPGVICLYGDHLPPIAGLRSRLGFAADVTDYLIVTDPAQSVPLPSRALSAAQLGQVLCRAAGLPSFREPTPRH